MSHFPRRSGLILHPTSLPGPYGIGDMGSEAYRFVDFLVAAGQTYWQMLPLNPTGYADSPYQGLSAFAGNPMLISPDRLLTAGHLTVDDLTDRTGCSDARVDFGTVIAWKSALLDRAFERFRTFSAADHAPFAQFCQAQAAWLDDVALFLALKQKYGMRAWTEWPTPLATRDPGALAQACDELADAIEAQKYRQWVFFTQWNDLRRYANRRGIRIIGDMPIFVALDSADVWAHPHLFHLDDHLRPTCVSGVPPDYFSETGQLWGHPLYRWDVMAADGYRWWIERFRAAFALADIVRIDHFRAFYNYWEIPAGESTAINGRWVDGPREALFTAVTSVLGDVAIIAEDLGDFTPESRAGLDALMARFGFPGMRILQFAFNRRAGDRFFPHNYPRACVVYTGTHDNDTLVGWFNNSSTDVERRDALRYLCGNTDDIAWAFIRTAWMSVADTALTTVQDLLGLGSEARMNLPGTLGAHNWTWRMPGDAFDQRIAERLRDLTEIYQRLP